MSKNPHAVALGRKGGHAGKGISTEARRKAAKAAALASWSEEARSNRKKSKKK